MKKAFLALSLSTTLLAGSFIGYGSASAQTNDSELITRGDFLKRIVEHLQLPLHDKNLALPQDVTGDSPYADTIRIMKERRVIVGYGDGTVRLENTLKPSEAYIIIARLLGIDVNRSSEIIKNDYGISFTQDMVTLDDAQKAIQQALVSDPTAHEWVIQSSEAMDKQDSFKANMIQKMNMVFKEKLPENNNMDSVSLSMNVEMEFKKDQGFRMISTSKLPQPLPNGETEITMEQYFVKNGMYIKMLNPETKKEEWMKMGNELPFTFEQMMEMQKNSVAYNQQINNKYIFYRDLGTETVDGMQQRKVAFQGRFASLQEMMNIMSNMFSNQELPESFITGSGLEGLTMSGIMWYDETTKLPAKISMQLDMELTTMENQQIKKLEIELSGSYYDFNQVKSITLPEEAKQAKELPSPMSATGTQE